MPVVIKCFIKGIQITSSILCHVNKTQYGSFFNTVKPQSDLFFSGLITNLSNEPGNEIALTQCDFSYHTKKETKPSTTPNTNSKWFKGKTKAVDEYNGEAATPIKEKIIFTDGEEENQELKRKRNKK